MISYRAMRQSTAAVDGYPTLEALLAAVLVVPPRRECAMVWLDQLLARRQRSKTSSLIP